MAPRKPTKRQPPRRQRGFALTGVLVAIAITTLLLVFGAVELSRKTNDAAAASTGRYLLAVRDALVEFQIRHEAWLSGVDISAAPAGTYSIAPPLTWTGGAGGALLAHGTVGLLQTQGLLSSNIPANTPLGERAQFVIVRQGTCPGLSCTLESYVYTCHPISSWASSKTGASCTAPTGRRAEYDPGLLGQVMLSSDGYGGHDGLDTTRFIGPLANANRAWFPISANRGHALVVATLGATPFGQFVRMGDTRPVQLRNRLTVSGVIQTDTGLLMNTSVAVGTACSVPRMIATTNGNELAICQGGVWSVSDGRAVQGVFSNLVNGAYVAPPVCQAPATPFRYISLQSTDLIVTGSNLNVHGNVSGNVSGSGTVNAAGNVSIAGTFNGSFQSGSTSSIRVAQSVSINASNQVQITPTGANARASLIQGCAL